MDNLLSVISQWNYGYSLACIGEALLKSTHNKCFRLICSYGSVQVCFSRCEWQVYTITVLRMQLIAFPVVIYRVLSADKGFEVSSTAAPINYSKCLKILYTKVSDKMAYWHANSVAPDQTAGAVWSGFTLFTIQLIILKSKCITRGPWWPCNAHLSIIALWEPDLELIKANILIKIQNDYINK